MLLNLTEDSINILKQIYEQNGFSEQEINSFECDKLEKILQLREYGLIVWTAKSEINSVLIITSKGYNELRADREKGWEYF